jgi:D-sedoheptulose 7-phosphate isomerase
MINDIAKQIRNASAVIAKTAALRKQINSAVNFIAGRMMMGGKLVIFGNGGSAADAQHAAGELVGRFARDRKGFPAMALTTDASVMTSIANDYGYETIFARQAEALVNGNDVVIALSTSGESESVLEGIKKCREKGAKVIGLTGKSGGKMKNMVDVLINIPSVETWHVQEAHIVVLHVICGMVEKIIDEQSKTR